MLVVPEDKKEKIKQVVTPQSPKATCSRTRAFILATPPMKKGVVRIIKPTQSQVENH